MDFLSGLLEKIDWIALLGMIDWNIVIGWILKMFAN